MGFKLTDCRLCFILAVLPLLLICVEATDLCAAEETEPLSAHIGRNLWPCNELSALAEKYGVSRKLPDTTFVEKQELVRMLSATLEQVVKICGPEGTATLPSEDRELLVKIHAALKTDLALYEGYQSRWKEIESILAQPEVPDFQYKLGVAGFLRGEGAGNFLSRDFVYKPGSSEGHFLYRVKPYVYWHPTDYLDIHAEGQGYGFDGGQNSFHRSSLYQGFAEARLPQSDRISLKIGRQEFSYGSTFILGTDSFFDGLSFDAVRLRGKPFENVTVDLFGGYYARPFSGGISGSLAGIYATVAFAEGNAIEAYAIRDDGTAIRHSDEKLYNFGLRGTAVVGPVALEFEPVYQSGDFFSETLGKNVPVNAYGGHIDANITAPLGRYNSKLLLGYAYGSGDKASVAGVSAGREFRNPNNTTSLVGDMSMIGDLSGITVGDSHASGLQIYTVAWGIDFSKELNFSATSHYFIANHVPDGFSRQIGLETDFSLTYALNGDLSVLLGYDHFFMGHFFRDASGRSDDADYGYLMFQFNLSRQKSKAKKS